MDASWVVAGCAILTALIAIGTQWMRYENRLTEVKAGAASALQVGAEAAEECKTLAAAIANLAREMSEDADRCRREFGETVNAMQQKIHEFETWARDEFVRKQSLEAMLARTEKAQETRDDRLEKRLDRIERKLDAVSAHRSQE
jgi:hypothetical protein